MLTASEKSKSKIKVIDSLWTFFIALAFFGPFALPLLWRNPRFSLQTKVVGSVVVILFTLFLLWVTQELGQRTLSALSQYSSRP